MSKRRDMELLAQWQRRLESLACWDEVESNDFSTVYNIGKKYGTFVELRNTGDPEIITCLAWETYHYPLKDVRDIRLGKDDEGNRAVVIKVVNETVKMPLG